MTKTRGLYTLQNFYKLIGYIYAFVVVLISPPFSIQLINNAGYFYEPVEKIDSLNFKEELKMIDICALGPLRVTAALYNGGLLKPGESKVAVITSQVSLLRELPE